MTYLGDTSYWDGPAKKAQNLLGVWFAASHQPWMNLHFMLIEICIRKEWQIQLRQELQDYEDTLDYDRLQNLPLLDSFLKETWRMNPLDTRESKDMLRSG